MSYSDLLRLLTSPNVLIQGVQVQQYILQSVISQKKSLTNDVSVTELQWREQKPWLYVMHKIMHQVL